MTNIEFKQIEPVDSIQKVIKEVFDLKLDISGGWGYDNNSAIIVEKLDMPIEQFIHMFATMRANIEMNLTLEEGERYTGINLTLEDSKKFEINNKIYNIVSFKITAMKEKVYTDFIQEYKDGYGKKDFDLTDHFDRRKQNSITREVDYWFYGLED
ncbi:MAG: hypothetical protein KAQ94_07740 [Arcobacteraceae bacterium]|nr:hypothetical protein [Arcobacteraceae bacterium]